MARARGSSAPSGQFPTLVAFLSLIFSLLTVGLSIAGENIRGKSAATVIAVAAPIALVFILAAIFLGRLYRTIRVPVVLALGGPPGVGKTVFVNVLCSSLSEQESSMLSFLPETETAQQVYRVVGGLRQGVWPKRTTTDHIDRYRGKVGIRKGNSIVRLLLYGKLEFNLELGDAAGENWTSLAQESSSSLRREGDVGTSIEIDSGSCKPGKPVAKLIESTFFEYVGEADALLYFIGCDVIRSDARAVSEFVDDLISTIQVLRIIEDRNPTDLLRRPVAVILSKSDLLTPAEYSILQSFVYLRDRSSNDGPRLEEMQRADTFDDVSFAGSVRQLEQLDAVLRRQCELYRTFIVSSVDRVTDEGNPVMTRSEAPSVVEPIEWIFMDLWRRRRFRER